METKIVRKLLLGFIQIHILHHAKAHPIYGKWMLEELHNHGYEMSAGTLYPILHHLQEDGLLTVEDRTVNGKVRKYYSITNIGIAALEEAQAKAYELFKEIRE